MDLDNEVLKLTCELYGNFRFTRADVRYILDTFRNFMKDIYNPFLLQLLHDRLANGVSDEAFTAIDTVFDKHNDPFKKYESEDKRFRLYKQLKLYTEPEMCELEEQRVATFRGSKALVKSKTITMVHLPLPDSLTRMFEMDGLLDATI